MKIEFYDSRDKISHWPFFISLALSLFGLFSILQPVQVPLGILVLFTISADCWGY